MKVASCENPVRIYDKDQRKFIYVPCGKCNCCRNIKKNVWVDRLIQESQCWPYTVFFTLTFDERNLPTFDLLDDDCLCDVQTGECIYLSDVHESRTVSPMQRKLYIHRRKSIPYVTVDVVQSFVKRMRYYINNFTQFTDDKPILRYFIVSEYGPSTYRPHIHGLFFFQSKIFASRFQEALCKAWKVGSYDWSFVRDSAASYVAGYVNSVQSLPRIYLHPRIRPFIVCSKQPPIGTLQVSDEEVKEIFNDGVVRRTIHDYKRMSFKDVPLWRSLKDRIFPKIRGFDLLSHQERVTLYGVYRCSKAESFEDFLKWCEGQFKLWYSLGCHVCENSMVSRLYEFYKLDEVSSSPGNYYSLRNLYYVSRRVYLQRSIFCVSLETYVRKIEDYYSNLSLSLLKSFYELQQDYVSRHRDARPLVYLYPDYVYEFNYDLNLSNLNRLLSFGFDPSHDLSLQLRSAFDLYHVDYVEMVRFNHRIFRQSMKTKKKNEYLKWIESNEFYRQKFNFNFYKDYA